MTVNLLHTRSTMYGAVTRPILPTTPFNTDSIHLSVVGYTSVCHTNIICQAADIQNLPRKLSTDIATVPVIINKMLLQLQYNASIGNGNENVGDG